MYARDIDIPSYDKDKKLRLVKPDPKYASITMKWIEEKEVTQYLGADFSKMTQEDEIKHLEGMLTDEDRYSWMIELDGEIVGNFELNEIKELSEKYKTKACAFCVLIGDPKGWGKGLGTVVTKVGCDWAFEEGGFEIIEAKAYVQNVRSWKIIEKLGYHYEGIEKGEVAGEPVDWKVYTLKKSNQQR